MPTDVSTATQTSMPMRLLGSALGAALASMGAHAHAETPAAASAEPDASAPPTELEGVTVDGRVLDQPVSPKFTAPLLETPRSVTVLPQALIDETAATDLADALRLVPGITFGAGEGGNPQGDRPFLRGFDAQGSLFVDGVRDVGAQSRETFDLQQIEVIRGADAVYSGRSNGGGSINLVSKAPLADTFARIGFDLGNADYRRATVDANTKIGDAAALRVNLMGHDAGVAGRDEVHARRFGFAPSLTLGLDSPTSATIGFYHLGTEEMPDAGIPYHYSSNALPAGVRVVRPDDGGDRNHFYGLLDRDFRSTQTDIGTLQLRHEFAGGLALRNTTRYGRSRQDYILTQPDDNQGDVADGEVWRRANTRAGNATTAVNQTDLSGTFDLGGMRHAFDVGLELARETSSRDSYVVPNLSAAVACGELGPGAPSYWNCTSLFHPDPRDPWLPGTYDPGSGTFTPAPIVRANAAVDTRADTRALYAFDTIRLDPHWLLNLGARFDRFSTIAPITYCPGLPGAICPRGYTGTRVTEQHRSTSTDRSWQAGIVWKPVEQASVYLSWATAATPPGSFLGEGSDTNPISSADLDPERTRNLELGVKWDLARGLTLAADVFDSRKTDARQLDADGAYANIGSTRVRGLELSASGRIGEHWSVFAGYAYMQGELVDGGFVNGVLNPLDGTRLANTPRHGLSLWSAWQVAPRVSIGAGAFHVSDVVGSFRVNTADGLLTEYGVPSYWRFDAMASWQATPRLALRLNLQNLTDATYYTKAYPIHFAVEAPGRTAIASATFAF